jgi:hypothetical protein
MLAVHSGSVNCCRQPPLADLLLTISILGYNTAGHSSPAIFKQSKQPPGSARTSIKLVCHCSSLVNSPAALLPESHGTAQAARPRDRAVAPTHARRRGSYDLLAAIAAFFFASISAPICWIVRSSRGIDDDLCPPLHDSSCHRSFQQMSWTVMVSTPL